MRKFFLTILLIPFYLLAQQDVQVNSQYHVEAEFDVKINPTNPNNIVLAIFNVDLIHSSIYYTFDGGNTWQESNFKGIVDSSHTGNSGDPVLTFSNNGDLFFTYITMDTSHKVDTALAKSTDGGATWQNVMMIAEDNTDKPWTAINTFSSTANYDNIYVILVENQAKLYTIHYDSNTQAYNKVHNVSITDGQLLPSIVVKKDGTLFTSTLSAVNPNRLYVQAFSQNGSHLDRSVEVASFPSYLFHAPDVSMRFQPAAYLAIDNSGGAHDGRLYLAYTAEEQGQHVVFDIFLTYSDDNGQTWSTPRPIHPSASAGTQQFYSSIFVNPEGKLIISWFDRRNHPQGSKLTDFYVGVSSDGGETFQEVKVNSALTDFSKILHSGNNFGVGDYQNITATNNMAYVFWADGREGNGDVNLYMAKIDLTHLNVISYSNISTDISMANIYPQPVENTLHTSISTKKDVQLQYRIYDLNGKELFASKKVKYPIGKHAVNINLNLPAGNYFVLFTTDSGYLNTQRFIKQ